MTSARPAGRRLWLVRHGETEGQSSIRYHGENDVPLADTGRRQIRALLPLLRGVAFTRVVHSPLMRARESAALLASGLDLAPQVLEADARLREISFGACEGMTREEIDDAFPTFFADYEAGRVDAFPGGEPRPAFARRVGAAVLELAADDAHRDVLVVAHRGTVRHALLALLGGEPPSPGGFAVELGSLTVLRWAGRWQLELLGVRGDLGTGGSA